MITYEVREFVKNGVKVYEVWAVSWTRSFWRWRSSANKLTNCTALDAAENFVSEHAGGYYDTTRYYDSDGKPIRGGY
jgi:hypothetical protein